MEDLPTCWEINRCGREKGGHSVSLDGECISSIEQMGHSCWVVAGTISPYGPTCILVRDNNGICASCKVFSMYRLGDETKRSAVKKQFPKEHKKYMKLLLEMERKSSPNERPAWVGKEQS
ncbi:MAG: hypothetical protein KAI75_04405 [Desulfobulbaceae bacterium]|nr:hypothetical protein [Desulfobulbaceae bacterium]